MRWALTNNPVPSAGAGNRFSEDMDEDSGQKGLNYRAEPAWFRLGFPPHLPFGPMARLFFQRDLFSNGLLRPGAGSAVGDPETPVFTARPGRPARMHVIVPDGITRNGVFTVHGHVWEREPYEADSVIQGPAGIGDNPTSQLIGAQEGIGPSSHWDIVFTNGAGGAFAVPGDYLYRMMDSFKNLEGQWGLLRVE
jgi:hypothetical protein